ncbi:MAG: hypothetical protein IJ507_09705 [Clostridia bacterium]|nr:hypothetical protein [Clostridia bacterium]
MASYTIEDIELIRKKSGISYQEAVALLDYHNGNVARALVDLERNGRIKPENEQKKESKSTHHEGKKGFMKILQKMYQFRIKVRKDNVPILNLSLLFMLLTLLVSPHILLIGVILMLILGYKVSFEKRDNDFVSANLEKMVRNAAQNVKDSVASMAQEFSDLGDEDGKAGQSESTGESTGNSRSYYQSNPAATTYRSTYTGSAPTLQVPVQVESQDGKVTVESDQEGFTNATVE